MKPNFQFDKNIPVIGITMGDPAGIGPEITMQALSNPEIYKICYPIILGDINVLKKTVNTLNINLKPIKVDSLEHACFKFGQPEIISLSDINVDKLSPSIPTKENGNAMLSYINKSIELAMDKKIDGIVTSPITKTA
ncbi:MAG: 4-hydroxythreonine-4-phosphate dehydrogenase PdxA, partial [Desulfobacteraceae bacterium]|nr:4-hydroxythreonine-4-phosphate dehydrogenase PdxA [Desulfobacteraceae bacterium]